MQKTFFTSRPAVILALLLPCLLGFSSSTMTEIETAIIREDYARARNLAQEALRDPAAEQHKGELLYYLGLSQLNLGQYPKARRRFQEILSTKPPERLYDRAYIGITDCFFLEEHYEDALNTIERLLRYHPRSEFRSLIYLKLARANLKLAQWDEAQNALNKVIRDYPDSPEYHSAKQLLEEKQYFAVQVGSFLDRIRAEKLVTELKNKGEYAYIVETEDKDGTSFYRVRVGELTRLTEAKHLRRKLSNLGYPTLIYP